MLRKLYAMVAGSTCPDNPDSPQHHEVLLPGFLYGMIIKERFDESLNGIKAQIAQDIRQNKPVDFTSGTFTLLPHNYLLIFR
jgi:DNA-directed RNA polymerase I subunit RPA2